MVNHMKDITQMQEDAERRNTEVLAMIRELAQKPHEPHAAFWHCAKPHAEIKFEVTGNPS
jgi:hypothetical protein